MSFGHRCENQIKYKRRAKEMGLPAHGAPFPVSLVDFLIRFLSKEGELVLDPFSGSFTVARAAENLNRRWIGTDIVWEYVRGGAERMRDVEGFLLYKSFLVL